MLQSYTLFISKTNFDGSASDFGSAYSGAHLNLYSKDGGGMSSRLGDTTNNPSSVTDSLGVFIISRKSSSSYKQYKDGSLKGTKTSTSIAFSTTPLNIYDAAFSYYTSVIQYSPRKRTFVWGGKGITDTEALNISTHLTTFESELNR